MEKTQFGFLKFDDGVTIKLAEHTIIPKNDTPITSNISNNESDTKTVETVKTIEPAESAESIEIIRYNKLRLCLNENQFIIPSYTHYGGNSGFQDYGILGVKIKNKLINLWRDTFLWKDNIDELDTPIIMPYDLLKASGHVDRFTDYVVYDANNICYRADHLVKDYFNNHGEIDLANTVDNMTREELEMYINKYKMVPVNNEGTDILKVVTKNLMFPVPSNTPNSSLKDLDRSLAIDFLRPELAQGLFVNFKICQQFYNECKLVPYGLCQIGKSYRNEITTKSFTRLREFTQAEIEYFVDPENKTHHLFDDIKNQKVKLLSAEMQSNNINDPKYVTIDEACTTTLISHKTMGYFLSRIYQFALKVGLNEDKIRFRQHLPNEMAHYALECWDLETFVNSKWLECIGCADRGDYDLKAHSVNSNIKFTLKRTLNKPINITTYYVKPNKSIIGKKYKELTSDIVKYFETLSVSLSQDDANDIQKKMDKNGSLNICIRDNIVCSITKEMIDVCSTNKVITTEEYYPHVIEPSFGIDRLLYSIFDHNFWYRNYNEDQHRVVLSLPKELTPYDVAIFQLYNRDDMINMATTIKTMLIDNKMSCYIDNSSVTIGKRYARLDEIGVKFAITIDPGSLNDNSVTIRDRDSMKQIRVCIDKIVETLVDL